MRISFDFDSTLSELSMQNLCKILKLAGADIFIITARCHCAVSDNRDLFNLAIELNILRENIYFTCEEYKYKKIKQLQIDLHFDDMEDEVLEINQNGGNALLFGLKDISELSYLFNI